MKQLMLGLLVALLLLGMVSALILAQEGGGAAGDGASAAVEQGTEGLEPEEGGTSTEVETETECSENEERGAQGSYASTRAYEQGPGSGPSCFGKWCTSWFDIWTGKFKCQCLHCSCTRGCQTRPC